MPVLCPEILPAIIIGLTPGGNLIGVEKKISSKCSLRGEVFFDEKITDEKLPG
jgi:hypothetical protein